MDQVSKTESWIIHKPQLTTIFSSIWRKLATVMTLLETVLTSFTISLLPIFPVTPQRANTASAYLPDWDAVELQKKSKRPVNRFVGNVYLLVFQQTPQILSRQMVSLYFPHTVSNTVR